MPPLCPKCKSPMVIKTAHRGTAKEHEFWSCSRFPSCRGSLSIEPTDKTQPTSQTVVMAKRSEQPKQVIDITPVKYEGEPFNGFESMDSFETIACDNSVLAAIRNGNIDATVVKSAAKFRVDYTKSGFNSLSSSQRQISALVLRLLCRGSITKNTASVERKIERLFPGEVEYSDSDFIDSRVLTTINPDYPFDSTREEQFAKNILSTVLGPHWTLFTNTQMFVQSLGKIGAADVSFAGQRVDFVVSTSNIDVVIELDGEEHIHHIDKDSQRNDFLQRNGYKVFRIANEELDDNPESVMQTLEQEFRKISHSGNPSSVTQKRIIAAKLIHQIQIALTSGLIHSTISPKCTVGYHAKIGGFESQHLRKIMQIAIDDLGNLFENYCSLYGETPFFDISLDSKSPDAMVCIGSCPGFNALATIAITDITTNHKVENTIPSYSDLQLTNVNEETLLYFLDYVFHFPSFREGQLAGIERLLNGQDSIVLLPTGSGKSLIYQLAAFMCPGKVIVVSPLISLMQDQLDNLFYNGIDSAIQISGDNNLATSEINNPGTVLLYVTPERLQIKGFRDAINSMQSSNRVFAVAVDEAHCVSEWGHDFRTAYLNIGRTSRAIFNRNGMIPTIIALTGTASTAVLKDVKRELEITEYDAIITPESFDRNELKFKVLRSPSHQKKTVLFELIDRAIPDFFGNSSTSFYRLSDDETNCGIVFCPHVKGDYGVTKVRSYLYGTPAVSDVYSGSSPIEATEDWDKIKLKVATKFKSNKVNTLVATKAFGMGIDKPNVRFTVHYGIPSSIESFYQEAGRAGRDGKDSLCALILSDDNQRIDDEMLNPTASLERIQEIIDAQTIDQRDDISRMLWFHVNSFKGIDFEVQQVDWVINKLFIGNQLAQNVVTITCGGEKTDNSMKNVQKALQRLLVLGVIKDYTVDNSSREIYVMPGSSEPVDIQAKYAVYVKGYNEGRISMELSKLSKVPETPRRSYVLHAARILTEFVYDTIEKGRRRGLREMVNAAVAALKSKNPDQTLRQRIVRYFESTYSEELTEVIESSNLGFDTIPKIIDGTALVSGGEVIGGIRSANEASGLRGGVSRYLESTPDHPGLLALRALAELHCKDYDINSIKDDLEAACNFAVNRYSCNKDSLFDFVVYFMRKVIERNPALFATVIEGTSPYVNSSALCESLIDSLALTDAQKTAPAILYFSDMAKKSKKLIGRIMEA